MLIKNHYLNQYFMCMNNLFRKDIFISKILDKKISFFKYHFEKTLISYFRSLKINQLKKNNQTN